MKLSDYFNYGYKEAEWVKHVEKIRPKFDELNEMVKKQAYKLPSSEDAANYLFNFPSDFGGVGEVFNDQNYEKVNFFDMKNSGNHKLYPVCRMDHFFVPLPQFNNNINSINSDIHKNNSAQLNPNLNPQSFPFPNILHPNYYMYFNGMMNQNQMLKGIPNNQHIERYFFFFTSLVLNLDLEKEAEADIKVPAATSIATTKKEEKESTTRAEAEAKAGAGKTKGTRRITDIKTRKGKHFFYNLGARYITIK